MISFQRPTLKCIYSLFALLCLFFQINLWAGNSNRGLDPQKKVSQYIIDSWQTEDGLPQNSVRSIAQTKDGYIWLATEEGLAIFDGVSFKIIDKQNCAELKQNFVNDLFLDNEDNLWISSHGGGVTLFGKNGKENINERDGLSSGFIKAVFKDSKNRVWIGTDGKGLNLYQNGRVTKFGSSQGLPNGIRDFYEDSSGKLWIATSEGVFTYTGSSFNLIDLPYENDNVSVISISGDGNNIWIGTEEDGAVRINSYGEATLFNQKNGLSSNFVRCVYVDSYGMPWIGTTAGLNRIKNNKAEILTTAEGLTSESIYSIMQDKEGSLWLGTAGGGLNRLRDGKFTTYSMTEGLNYDVIWSVYEDRNGKVWIGTDGGGVNIIDGDKVSYITTKQGLGNDVVFAFLHDSKDNIWIGTYTGGISKYSNGKITNITTRNGLKSDVIRSVVEDSQGNIWVGTTKGLNLIVDGKVKDVLENSQVSRAYIRTLLSDSRGRIWIGTRGDGVYLYANGSVKHFTEAHGLSNNTVRSLMEDSDGDIWMGTSAGLNKYTGNGVSKITKDSGLFDDPVFSILEDGRKNFWISCNKGVYYVSKSDLNAVISGNKEKLTCVNFGKDDGMKSSECNGTGDPAAFKVSDGRLWFPTIRGLATVNPNRIKHNDYIPPVIIEKFIANGTEQNIDSTLSIEAGTDKFEFHYTGLSYLIPKNVKFKYMLEGLDEDWIDAGTRRIAYYNNIPPGDYVFKVKACNNDGIWNEAGTSYAFSLNAFIYETIWFYLAIVLLIALIAFRVYKYQMKKMQERADELQKQVNLAEDNYKRAEEQEAALKVEMSKTEEAMNTIRDEQEYLSRNVETMLNQIENFSEGDLTVELTPEREDEIAKLFLGFNQAVENVRAMLEKVNEVVAQTAETNRTVIDHTIQVSNGAELQAEQSLEVVGAVEEMARTIHATTENVTNASQKAKDAGENAMRGGEIVAQTLKGMEKISESVLESSGIIESLGKSTEKIGNIIQVIDDIADQTNLLALNAAIEAARAGEHGRGFAIVADEVRKLSERTTNATKEIAGMIKAIQTGTGEAVKSIEKGEQEVSNGRSLAGEAENALKLIINDSGNLAELIDQVAAASEQQSATSDEISKSIESISAVTKQTSDSIKDIAVLIETLGEINTNLQGLMSKFRVTKEHSHELMMN